MSSMSVRVPSTSSGVKLAAMLGGPVLALMIAACGSSGSSSSVGSGNGAGSTAASSGAGVAVANTSLGPVLVNAQGMTLYLLTADSPGKSSCSAQCLVYWPAVSAAATGGPGVTAKVGRATTTGGAPILTAGQWPLYTFAQDQAPGDVTGEGVQSFGGTWYAVSPAGQPVKPVASSSTRSY
jgi:predicted lipoprotein with Yx(FWY)xxD motif